METALSDLVAQLAADVPARNAVPADDQYTRCVTDAVADFSRRAGRVQVSQLRLEAGMASYPLPDGFVRLVQLVWPSAEYSPSGGVLITSRGLVPYRPDCLPRHTIAGGRISFYPAPVFAATVDLVYQAGWVLDEEQNYPELGEEESGIVLQLAAARALEIQANAAAQEAWSYQLGDERVSHEKLAEALGARAQAARQTYLERVAGYVGPIMTR